MLRDYHSTLLISLASTVADVNSATLIEKYAGMKKDEFENTTLSGKCIFQLADVNAECAKITVAAEYVLYSISAYPEAVAGQREGFWIRKTPAITDIKFRVSRKANIKLRRVTYKDKRRLLLQYTATVKEVEVISGQHFKMINMPFMEEHVMKLHVNTELW
ncbi:hypothetical protein COOONC_04106 [Cooperia oncophora]